ncbi:hypothetical protein EV424DRAFT_1433488 [Suillus variegatus]|nr:hypothetical protein EV424DRAFT_1433488 [Suillus variegatus]
MNLVSTRYGVIYIQPADKANIITRTSTILLGPSKFGLVVERSHSGIVSLANWIERGTLPKMKKSKRETSAYHIAVTKALSCSAHFTFQLHALAPPASAASCPHVIRLLHYSYLFILLGYHLARSLHLLDGLPSLCNVCVRSPPRSVIDHLPSISC